MLFQSSVVRQKFPLMAAYSRQVLSRAEAHAFMPLRVAGFPCLKVLRVIRHPIAAAFPVRVLRIRSCKKKISQDNIWGFPSSCVCLFVHATVYVNSAGPPHPRTHGSPQRGSVLS
jgi:hypothetical protein